MSANSGRQEKGEEERSKEYIKLKGKQEMLNLKQPGGSCAGLHSSGFSSVGQDVGRQQKSQGNPSVGMSWGYSACEERPVEEVWGDFPLVMEKSGTWWS